MARTPRAARQHIRTVAEIERQVLAESGFSQRIADRIANFAGTITFVIVQLALFAIWIAINSNVIPGFSPFDPFPYTLLSLVVACEAVLISTFVLIKQNAMSRAAEARDHLNLQIDLLTESEATKILHLQRLICRKLGIEEALQDEEAKDLSTETQVANLASEIQKTILEE